MRLFRTMSGTSEETGSPLALLAVELALEVWLACVV